MLHLSWHSKHKFGIQMVCFCYVSMWGYSWFIIILTCFICMYIVYENGKVCISILHPPGEDRFNELVCFLWLVALSLSFIMRCSFISGICGRALETNTERGINHYIGYIDALESKRRITCESGRSCKSIFLLNWMNLLRLMMISFSWKVMWRNDKAAFKKRVREIVRRSQENL